MAEFTPITTQEQFDAAIGERLKRDREVQAKKYEDYDALKTKVSDYEKQIGELGATIDASSKKYADYEKTLADLQGKIKSHETNSVKMRIAHETGIPYELFGRLSGESEEDIRKDAETLAKFISGSEKPAPLRSTESEIADTKTAALKTLTSQLINKGD